MVLDIKKVVKDDVSMVAILFDAYRVFYKQSSNLQAAFDFLEQRVDKNESTIFMATIQGEAVGFVQLYPIFSSVSLQPAWLLNDLYVAEHARRQGVAESLLQQAKQFALETKAAFVLLQTSEDNYKAQSVYEKNGWIKLNDFFYEYPL
jgi:ribosomal protein S18 acetylase RimI-like enzyme